MKSRAQVKQVVFGGSARTGPMQAVGAVKGAQTYAYGVILEAIGDIFAEKTLTSAQTKTLEEKYGDIVEPANYALSRAAPEMASVNVRNNIREGDESATPLQFVYEAADCRLFFTAEMYAEQSLIWRAAYNAIWRGAACVEGSTGHPSSISGAVGMNAPPGDAYESTSVFPEDLTPVSMDEIVATNGSNGTQSSHPYEGGAASLSFGNTYIGLFCVAVGFAAWV